MTDVGWKLVVKEFTACVKRLETSKNTTPQGSNTDEVPVLQQLLTALEFKRNVSKITTYTRNILAAAIALNLISMV